MQQSLFDELPYSGDILSLIVLPCDFGHSPHQDYHHQHPCPCKDFHQNHHQQHSHHHRHSIINLAVFSWKLSAWADHEASRRTDMCFGLCRSTCVDHACGKYSQHGYLWWAFGLTDNVVNHSRSKTPPCESFKHPPFPLTVSLLHTSHFLAVPKTAL